MNVPLNEVEKLRFIMMAIWALLIGGALAYVLASMADDAFNMTQSLVYSAAVFVGILLISGVLKAVEPK